MHSAPRLRTWVDKAGLGVEEGEVERGGAWMRRTPHAVINVLRADQLQKAEGRRDTQVLYAKNIAALRKVGWDVLEDELRTERGGGVAS